jgi:transposase
MAEASDMITELKNLQDGLDTEVKFHIIMIADRGYVSEENITEMRNAGLGFILMLRKNMGIVDEVLDAHVSEVKITENYDEETGRFGLSFAQKLFEDDKQNTCFHIVWDGELERKHRDDLMKYVAAAEHRLQNAEKRHTRMTKQELDSDCTYFDIQCHEEGTLIVKKRGRGAGEDKEVPSYVIDSFARNREAIDRASNKCGYMVLVSSEPMSAKEAMLAMSRRDCVEKTFRALKSSLGMDKMGVHSEPSLHTKSLIWFVASILHALIFSKTEKLRVKDRKRSTVPALVEQYEEITADRDLTTRTYQRRYKLTKMQRQDLAPCGVSLDMIDRAISDLPGNARSMPRV